MRFIQSCFIGPPGVMTKLKRLVFVVLVAYAVIVFRCFFCSCSTIASVHGSYGLFWQPVFLCK